MNRILFTLTLLCFTQLAISQVNFEQGYFINENNIKTECLIQNYDWNIFPSEIEYKLSDSSTINKINTSLLKEIKINNTSHYYKKYYVDIDSRIEQKSLVFEKKNIFLQVLIEGEASLLKYKYENIYFYELGKNINQLVHKEYTENQKNKKDNRYKQELYNNLKCSDLTLENFQKLEYRDNQLVRLFEEYNNCTNSEYKNYISKQTKFDFNLKLFTGLTFYTLNTTLAPDVIGSSIRTETSKNSSTGIIAGIEAELKLPFKHNRWSVFMSSSYNSYKETSKYYDELLGGYKGTIVIDNYSCIEVSLGAKYYFHINENSNINLNLAYGNVLELNSENMISFEGSMNPPQTLKFKSNNRNNSLIRLGLGYTFSDKYSLDLNYYPTKIMSQSDANGSFTITIGYNFL